MTVLLSPEELTLDDLVTDPMLEEIWINGPNQVFVEAPLFSISLLPGILGAESVTVSAHASRVVSRYGVPR